MGNIMDNSEQFGNEELEDQKLHQLRKELEMGEQSGIISDF